MIRIRLSALGLLRQYIPELREISIVSGLTLEEIALQQGVPRKSLGAYMVNGILKQGDYCPAESDDVRLFMLMGAG